MQPDAETSFLIGMTKLYYGLNVKKQLKKIATKISWAKGWPEDNKAFWEAEAFMWQYKIDKKIRDIISKELSFLNFETSLKKKKLNNLDLGCGAYSYLPSTGFDFSEKMLLFNENCHQKVQGDLEKNLPFRDKEFSSITAIFILNYIKNIDQLLVEINRILKNKGYFVAILSDREISSWPAQKVVNKLNIQQWKNLIQNKGFDVNIVKKSGLWIFRAKKE
ncbi:class I SAM-dependent methyltransferase [Candidatus Woesearchaeota archaeon]|nr:class I SAM-dependent methyltransferase [Candidatus Woesearchaeota archaeon]